ncbi:MAG: cation diffusion facilitator family transporter [Lachnospiraceae bacterium]|nr:cation diffusion facilitator family transporter [Lachnospiraceae bacterium]
MISFLAKYYIKEDEKDQQDIRREYGILLGKVGIFFNIVLFIIKMIAGIITGSVAIFADALNNISDSGSSLIQLIGYRLSGQEPDTEHPFGHGRLEYISGLVIAMAILFMGLELLKTAIGRIIDPVTIEYSRVAIAILIISIAVKLYMYCYNKKYSEKYNSVVMQATAFDSLSDCIATTAVLLAMVISESTGLYLDGYFGILVSIFIIVTGFNAAKDTISPLLGQKADEEFVNKIAQFALSYEDVLGVHDLIVHDYGAGRMMITFHAEVPANGDFVKLHDTIDNIERRLNQVLGCRTVIHMDPVFVNDEATIRMKRFCTLITKSISESLTIHDFRMVAGPTHIKLVFDVLAPYEVELTNAEIKKQIETKISSLPGNLTAVVDVDRPM